MINPAELRIGNKISLMHDASAPIFTIQEIRSSGVMGYRHSDRGDEYHEFEWLLPIALTPDILIKCGFEKDYDGNLRKQFNPVMELFFNEGNYKQMDLRQYGSFISFKHAHIKYLHHLQNLFYCLSGEELTVSNL